MSGLHESNIDKLAAIFPEVVTEAQDEEGEIRRAVDFERLRMLLTGEIPDGREYYAFTWAGKRKAELDAGRGTDMVLRPCVEESVNFGETENLYIEGDNLEVLKILRKSYMHRVKMIYIDPPYNTGHDFLFDDDFSRSEEEERRQSGFYDEEGRKNFSPGSLHVNRDSNPRYHSDWCSMIYPRLKVAKDLLSDDGVIFISIDDNEAANLRKMCDEIFGEDNFVAMFPWQSRQSVQNDTDISCNHEYVIAYARNRRKENRRLKESNASTWYTESSFACLPLPLDPTKFTNIDNDPRGPWKADPMDAPNIRPNLTYPIINTATGEIFFPPKGRCWRVEEKTFRLWLDDGRIVFGKTGETRPQVKTFYEEKKDFGSVDNTWWSADKCGTTTQATKELAELFGGTSPFFPPKPVKLIMQVLRLVSRPRADDIVLDFFAGSSTTAHALMSLNAQDGGKRKFIMVQLPEPCPPKSEAAKSGFSTIADIGRERIRRAGQNLSGDTGFRSLHLDTSTFRPEVFITPEQLTFDFLDSLTDNIKPDRSPLDLLFFTASELGLPLSLPYRSYDIQGFTVHEYGGRELIACFDENIAPEVITYIARLKPEHVAFRDSCFSTSADKINAEQIIRHYAPSTQVKIL